MPTINERDDSRHQEIDAISRQLEALAGPAAHSLVERLSDLGGEAMAIGEDRVLRIVRRLCLEFEERALWDRIACEALDLDWLSTSDEATYVP